MKNRNRGLKGRTIRVKGERGDFKIYSVNSDETFDVCRVKPGRGGRCVEFVLRREQFRFVRYNYEA